MKKDNLIADKTFEFSLQIISFYIQLKAENEFVLSKQLLRSGTSVGANVSEAMAAQSKKDFINKNVHSFKRSKRNKILVTIIG